MKWICRLWTETSENGWTSTFATFDTKEEAEEHGRFHVRQIGYGDLNREFEVYEQEAE